MPKDGIGDWGLGIGESGFGIRDSGFGNRESGIGNRESGIGNRESGIGNRESGIGRLNRGMRSEAGATVCGLTEVRSAEARPSPAGERGWGEGARRSHACWVAPLGHCSAVRFGRYRLHGLARMLCALRLLPYFGPCRSGGPGRHAGRAARMQTLRL
ncbi:hypothetical protein XarbCFBP6827_00800 [Xanthomonas arboricola]|nr:hypothetical protein XarbCFBP6827_00800 [Xanthomonas arboricola]